MQEIDRALQPHGELPDYSTIKTIEHVLPQTLDTHWKTALGNDAYSPDLPRVTNTLGNLCLNSQSANSSFGQSLFPEKQLKYTHHQSALNRDITEQAEPWSLAAIKKRSHDLAQVALSVWKWTPSSDWE